jgi:dTDP-4-dehydrorhamnose 3,5-epimerase
VVLDLRQESDSYGRHAAVELTAANRRMLYVPRGCAHGFQTLEDDTEVSYQISEFYAPEAARGVRWDDPAFGIAWPLAPAILSASDASYPLVGAIQAQPTRA